MLPRNPSLAVLRARPPSPPSSAIALLSSDSSVARNVHGVRSDVSIFSRTAMSDRKATIPEEAPRRARGADAAAHHRERGGAARNARAGAHLGERGGRARGRAPLDGLPPLPRRGGAVRGVQRALEAANPLPDIGAWAAIEDPDERLRAALDELYAYYRAHRADARQPPPRRGPCRRRRAEVRRLSTGTSRRRARCSWRGAASRGRARARERAAIGHALAFATWRSLAREQGLDDAQAAELMVRLVDCER